MLSQYHLCKDISFLPEYFLFKIITEIVEIVILFLRLSKNGNNRKKRKSESKKKKKHQKEKLGWKEDRNWVVPQGNCNKLVVF